MAFQAVAQLLAQPKPNDRGRTSHVASRATTLQGASSDLVLTGADLPDLPEVLPRGGEPDVNILGFGGNAIRNLADGDALLAGGLKLLHDSAAELSAPTLSPRFSSAFASLRLGGLLPRFKKTG